MDKKELRPVKIKTDKGYVKGYFHGYTTDSFYDPNGESYHPTLFIIEYEDGKVGILDPKEIVFTDK